MSKATPDLGKNEDPESAIEASRQQPARLGKSDDRKRKSQYATKAATVLGLLRRKKGASIDEMQAATGWQAHSLRGLLSGTIGKRMSLALESAPDKSGVRRYRIVGRPADREV